MNSVKEEIWLLWQIASARALAVTATNGERYRASSSRGVCTPMSDGDAERPSGLGGMTGKGFAAIGALA